MNLYKIMPTLSEIPTILHKTIKDKPSRKRAHVINESLKYYEIVFEDLKTSGERK